MLQASATGGVAAVALAACGGESRRGTPEPQRGGTLRLGTPVPFSGLDPHTEAGTGLEIVARIYGYALHVDSRDDSVIYDHAESVEQPDALTYVLHLRDGIRFQDVEPVQGRSVEAVDLRRSVERFRDTPIAPTRTFHTSILDRIEDIDPTTLRVTVKRPYVYTLSYLGDISAGAIIPHELLDQGASLYTTGAGSGPFRVDSASPPDRARLLRHDGYYRTPIPYLDAMEWRVYADGASAAVAALQSAEIDVMSAASEATVGDVLDDASVVTTRDPGLSSLALGVRADRQPFLDLRVRQAIDLAIDRDAIISAASQGEARVAGPVNPHLADGFWSLSDEEVRNASGATMSVDARRQEARALLAAAAAGASFAMQVADVPALLELADLIALQLQEVGISVRLEPLPLLTWFTNMRRGAFEATLINHLPYESADIPLRFFHTAGPDATQSPFGFSDAAIDALIERSWEIEDRAGRQEVVREAQQLMVEARPILGLLTGVGYSAASVRVQNLRAELPGSLAQYNYEQWLDAGDAD